jgi:urease accessory protein
MTDEAAAQLDLSFALRAGRTVLAHRHVAYPFYVTAPLRDRLPGAEIIVQSVSGGLFGDDRLGQRVTVGAAAEAVLRMPSASVVHSRRDRGASRQSVTLRAEAGARLFYLPRPVILLPGSGLVQDMDITVASSATVLLQDGFLMHDPAGDQPVSRCLDSRVTIRQVSGRRIALDRMRITDDTIDAAIPGVTGAYRAFGTVWLLRETPGGAYHRLKAALSPVFAETRHAYMAMTPLRDERGAMIRVAAMDGGDLDIATTAIRESLLQERALVAAC